MPAVAPYNFVALPDRIIPAEEDALKPVVDRYEAGRHTGWLELELTALTSVYTRGVLGTSGGFPAPIDAVSQGEKVQAADFFHRGENSDPLFCKPVLPGSSLRGMFESVFEIMAQSRPRFISNHRPFYRYFASAQSELRRFYAAEFSAPTNLVAGVLRRRQTSAGEQWYLKVSNQTSPGLPAHGFAAVPVSSLPAAYHSLRMTRKKTDTYTAPSVAIQLTGDPVTLLRGDQELSVPEAVIATLPTPGTLEASLILPGRDLNRPKPNQYLPSRSWYQAIFDPEPGSREFLVPKEVYTDYLEWGRNAHGSRFGAAEAPRVLEHDSPAFALISALNPGEVSTIGANMMLALRHTASPQELMQRSFSEMPAVDMAQALFGYVPTASEAAAGINTIRGRVFFEDGECLSPSWYLSQNDPVRVPPPLLGPKITAVQMYLHQPDAANLRHFSSSDAIPKGFKRYWHRPNAEALDALRPHDSPLERVETLMCPVRSGTQFSGRVRFENLTDAELGGLYASINLPWDEQRNICLAHKFGMGKSIGMGSLQVSCRRVVLLDLNARYSTFRRPYGEVVSGQRAKDDTEQILAKSYEAFVGYVDRKGMLWRRPRMKALARLMAWKPMPLGEYRNVGVQTQQGQPDYDIRAVQWKNRTPLGNVLDSSNGPTVEPLPPVVAVVEPIAPVVISIELAPPVVIERHILATPVVVGDTVTAIILRRFGKSQGDVKLDATGRELRNVKTGDSTAGDTVDLIVTAVNGKGEVTGVRRPAPD